MCKLKSYVRNRSRPEGSIAEGYLVEECLTFCSRYLHEGVQTMLNKSCRNNDECIGEDVSFDPFPNKGRPIGGKKIGDLISVDQKKLA